MKIQEHFGCKLRWFLYLIMMTSAGFPLSSLTVADLGWMEAHVPGDWKLEQLIIAKYHHRGSKRAAEWLLLKPEDETCCRGNVGFLRLTRHIGCRYIDTHCFISSPCLIAHTIFLTWFIYSHGFPTSTGNGGSVFYFWVCEFMGNWNGAWEFQIIRCTFYLSDLLIISQVRYLFSSLVMCEPRKKLRAFGRQGQWEMVSMTNKMTTLHLMDFGCTPGVQRLWDLDFRELHQPVSWQ